MFSRTTRKLSGSTWRRQSSCISFCIWEGENPFRSSFEEKSVSRVHSLGQSQFSERRSALGLKMLDPGNNLSVLVARKTIFRIEMVEFP